MPRLGGRARARSGLNQCFWCPNTAWTVDHLIPQWVFRLIPFRSASLSRREVACCKTCNRDKGNMPPSVFRPIRFDRSERKRQQAYWQVLQERVKRHDPEAITEVLRVMALPVDGTPRNDPEYVQSMDWRRRYANYDRKPRP